MRILLVEDNYDLAANIGEHLESEGHTVEFAYDGLSGLHLSATRSFDVIVLDRLLPGLDGATLCRRLREDGQQQTPVIMLTACDALDDKLAGFEAGADDYLTKPFHLRELAARVRALGHRRSARSAVLRVDDLELDVGTLVVRRAGRELSMNRTCLTLLQLLMRASPRVVRRPALEQALWGDTPPGSDALRTHIYTLRRVIDRPFGRPLITTVHGVGFRLAPP